MSSPVFRRRRGSAPGELLLLPLTDLDLESESQAALELRATVDEPGLTRCVVDAAPVFVDVRGLTVLLESAEQARRRHRRFEVIAPRSLRVMCRILDIGEELPLCNDSCGDVLTRQPEVPGAR